MTPLERWKAMAALENSRMREVCKPRGGPEGSPLSGARQAAISERVMMRRKRVRELRKEGKKVAEIAALLNVHPQTIKTDCSIVRHWDD